MAKGQVDGKGRQEPMQEAKMSLSALNKLMELLHTAVTRWEQSRPKMFKTCCSFKCKVVKKCISLKPF